jgi:hypothetical protein
MLLPIKAMLLWDPTNARAKLKIRRYPNKDDTTAWQVLCLFLACSNWGPQNACRFGAKKMVAKALDFAKQKGIGKRYFGLLRHFVSRNDEENRIFLPLHFLYAD